MVSRRPFFRQFAREVAVGLAEVHGHQHFRLSDLEGAPDQDLAALNPRLVDGHSVWISDGGLWVCTGADHPSTRLGPAEAPEQWILDRFDGGETVAVIAETVTTRFELEPALAFQRTRDLFMLLALNGHCAPANESLWLSADRSRRLSTHAAASTEPDTQAATQS